MAKLSLKIWHLLLVGLLMTPLLHCTGPTVVSAVEEDDVEDEVEVEDEDEVEGEDLEVADEEEEEPVTVPDVGDDEDEESAVSEEDEEEEEEEEELGPHPDADTTIIFTNRPTAEFVAGELVNSLIGFANAGEQDFVILGIEASFRYPQDFSYFIQNFSMITYETYLHPKTEVSFVYNFRPSESFYARPFGLVINIYYRDEDTNDYRTAVFNSTVNIVEVEEGFDAETFFMYVFMVSGLSLLMFIIHYVYTTVRRGGRSTTRKYVETGTQAKSDVDYQWIPEGATTTPKRSPRPSPRNRKTNKK